MPIRGAVDLARALLWQSDPAGESDIRRLARAAATLAGVARTPLEGRHDGVRDPDALRRATYAAC